MSVLVLVVPVTFPPIVVVGVFGVVVAADEVPVVVVVVVVVGVPFVVVVALVLVAVVDVDVLFTVTVVSQVVVPLAPLAVARYVVVVVGNSVRVPELGNVLVPILWSITNISALFELQLSVVNPSESERDVGFTERVQVGVAPVPVVLVAVVEVAVDCADANPPKPLMARSAARTSIPSAIGGIK